MNIAEYIASGHLEAYMLGALSETEVAEVLSMAAMYPEVAAELREMETVMERFALSLAKLPPATLEDKIWGRLPAAQGNIASETASVKRSNTIPFQPQYRKPAAWKYAAVVAGLGGSIALNAVLWMRNEHKNDDIAALTTKIKSAEQDQKIIAAVLNDYKKNKAMMSDTAMQTIVMHTVQPGHPMAATLYWSKTKGEAYVSADGLPTPPAGMQYQLWVMQNGKPVDMGVLPIDLAGTPGMQKVSKLVTDGQAFAISLEKQGGSISPTMQNIYVMGKVS